jgi:hypothetical protein
MGITSTMYPSESLTVILHYLVGWDVEGRDGGAHGHAPLHGRQGSETAALT